MNRIIIKAPSFLDNTLSFLANRYNKKAARWTNNTSIILKLADEKPPYIIKGNPLTNQVALIFKGYNNQIINILDKYNVKANFFTDEMDDNILSLVSKGHNIGSVNNKTWLSTLVMKTANQKYGYCYLEEKDKETLQMCSMNKYFVIKPSIIIKATPTISIKKNLELGSIISMDINKETINELEYIIKYIKSKGYEIVNLETLLEE